MQFGFLFFCAIPSVGVESINQRRRRWRRAERGRQSTWAKKTSLIRGARCSAFSPSVPPSLAPSLALFVRRPLVPFWSRRLLVVVLPESFPPVTHTEERATRQAVPRTHMEHDPLTLLLLLLLSARREKCERFHRDIKHISSHSEASGLFARALPPQGGFKPHQAKLKTRSDLFLQW